MVAPFVGKKELAENWLIDVPADGPRLREILATICRGHDPMGALLNVLTYEGSREATKAKLKRDEIQHIWVNIELKTIQERMNDVHKIKVSLKTIIKWMKQLKEWTFVIPDAYRHAYDVQVANIRAAIQNPPEPEKPKLRGRHAKKSAQLDTQDGTFNPEEGEQDGTFETSNNEDCTFNPESQKYNPIVKSSIRAQSPEVKSTILLEKALAEIELLRIEIVNLQSENLKVQTEIVNLQSSLSCEVACREALEAEIASQKITINTLLKDKDTILSDSNADRIHQLPVSSPIEKKKTSKSTRSRNSTPPKEVKQVEQPVLPAISEPDLSKLSDEEKSIYGKLRKQDQAIYLNWNPAQRAVYNNWIGGMYGYGYITNITNGVIETIQHFEVVHPSVDDFKQQHEWIVTQENTPGAKKYYTGSGGKGWQIWDAWSKWGAWTSAKRTLPSKSSSSSPVQPNSSQITIEEARAALLAAPHLTKKAQELLGIYKGTEDQNIIKRALQDIVAVNKTKEKQPA